MLLVSFRLFILLTDVFYFLDSPTSSWALSPIPDSSFSLRFMVRLPQVLACLLVCLLSFLLGCPLPARFPSSHVSCVILGSPPLAFHTRMLDSSAVSVVWVPAKALGDFVWIQAILHSSGSLLETLFLSKGRAAGFGVQCKC